MCLLIAKPAGIPLPTSEILRRAAYLNPHGCGCATAGKKPFKTMDYEVFYRYLQNVDDMKPLLLHFRYATHGSRCVANCHPFFDAATGVAFAHNGILDVRPCNDMTDSETAFKYLLLPVIQLHGIRTTHLKKTVDSIIGASRFAFMDKEGHIRTFGQFYEYKGCWYSNRNIFNVTVANNSARYYLCKG